MMRSADTLVVTGISSFVGTSLAQFLARDGRRVVGTVSRPAGEYDSLRDERIQAARRAGVEVAPLDFTDPRALLSFIEKVRPGVWVHHAGWAKDYGSLAYDLARGHQVNVEPLNALYAGLAKAGCRGVIVTGSSAEYSDTDAACKEDDPCWPTTPYGLSKLAETIRARQLAHEHGLRTRVARVFIPYGPLDAPNKLLPSVVTALRLGKSVDLSPCEQARDFLLVSDLAQAYGALIDDLQRDAAFDLFNVCSGRAVPLKQFLLEIAGIVKADPGLLLFGKRPIRPGEAPISYGSNEKASAILRWRPRPLREGLKTYLQESDSLPTSRAQERIP